MSAPPGPGAGLAAAVQLLGPVAVQGTSGPVPVAGIKAKGILAILGLAAGRAVGVDQIIDRVWGDDPPVTARNAVQVYVAGLRRVLRDAGAPHVLQSEPYGYRLDPAGLRIDAAVFLAQREAGLTALHLGERERAAAELRTALDCWRGPALADVAALPGLADEATHLDGLELASFEVWAELELEAGAAHRLLPELTMRARRDALGENVWRLLALARYQAGDQVGALAALRGVRGTLRRELGVDPGPGLRDLETAVLRHDPALLPSSPTRAQTETISTQAGRTPRIRVGAGAWTELGRASTVLGRDPGCDVVVDDPAVSGRHARLSRADDADVVADLGSRNGTRLNGVLINRATLTTGDVIELGHTRLSYDAGSDAVGCSAARFVGGSAAAGESAT